MEFPCFFSSLLFVSSTDGESWQFAVTLLGICIGSRGGRGLWCNKDGAKFWNDLVYKFMHMWQALLFQDICLWPETRTWAVSKFRGWFCGGGNWLATSMSFEWKPTSCKPAEYVPVPWICHFICPPKRENVYMDHMDGIWHSSHVYIGWLVS